MTRGGISTSTNKSSKEPSRWERVNLRMVNLEFLIQNLEEVSMTGMASSGSGNLRRRTKTLNTVTPQEGLNTEPRISSINSLEPSLRRINIVRVLLPFSVCMFAVFYGLTHLCFKHYLFDAKVI